MRTDQPPGLYPGIVMAPSLRDLDSSITSPRSMSVAVPMPSQFGHMPPLTEKVRRSTCVPLPLGDADSALAADRGDIERIGIRRSEVRFGQAGEESAQLRVDVGDRAHRRSGVGPDPLL